MEAIKETYIAYPLRQFMYSFRAKAVPFPLLHRRLQSLGYSSLGFLHLRTHHIYWSIESGAAIALGRKDYNNRLRQDLKDLLVIQRQTDP